MASSTARAPRHARIAAAAASRAARGAHPRVAASRAGAAAPARDESPTRPAPPTPPSALSVECPSALSEEARAAEYWAAPRRAAPLADWPPSLGLFAQAARTMLRRFNLRDGLARRRAADSSFLFKLGFECVFDQVLTALATLSTAAALSTVALTHTTALVNDIVLVYCLAPLGDALCKKSAPELGAAKPELGHCFEACASATLADRALVWVRKARLYMWLGAVTALASKLVVDVCLAPAGGGAPLSLGWVARTAALGAVHLGFSSNTRYQLVNGLEVLVYGRVPERAARIFSMALRTGNNYLGARLFMLIAAAFGA